MVSRNVAVVLCACAIVALTHTVLIGRKDSKTHGCLSAPLDKTLVVHIFADTDPEYLENLKFFIRYGILQEDNAEYIVLIQTDSSTIFARLPGLPDNAKYVQHKNECYDWGTVGWLLLHSGKVKMSEFKYFVITNSSVRGPFLPSYVQGHVAWYTLLTQRLSKDIKLVGPVISCGGTYFQGDPSSVLRKNPHVQSYVMAMDRETIEIFREEGQVFKCHKDRWDAIFYGELGSSLAILDQGFNIDSLLPRYQNVDWRASRNWECNAGINPSGELRFDGTTLHPYDAMFVKMKRTMIQAEAPAARNVMRYQQWMSMATGEQDLTTNEFHRLPDSTKAPYISTMRARGPACWDAEYYLKTHKDVVESGFNISTAWEHYVLYGQFEDRLDRLICDPYQDPVQYRPDDSILPQSL
ncbi:hypothetical protein WJX79_004145 [Trebouxia sp. C0005]